MAQGMAPLERRHLLVGVGGKAITGLTMLPKLTATTTVIFNGMEVLTSRMSKMILYTRSGWRKRETFIT